MIDENSVAWDEGWEIGLAGKANNNPYEIGTNEHLNWDNGYQSGDWYHSNSNIGDLDSDVLI